MTSNHLILRPAITVLLLAAPLVAEPGRADGQPLKPEVRFGDSTLEFALPNAMPRGTQMEVTILGPDDEVLVRETVAGPFFTWGPAGGAPDGDYRYEVRPVLPTAGAEAGSGVPETGPRARFRAGSFSWSNGTLTGLSSPSLAPDEGEPATNLGGPSQEANLVASSAAPEIAFDDTTTGDPDFRIFSNADKPFFNIAHGTANVIALRTDAGVDTGDSITVNATGDIGLADDTLFVDRSAGRVGIGTTTPTQELHIISSDGGDIRLSGSAHGEVWDIGILSTDGSLNLNDNTTPGNAFRIEKGTQSETLHLDSTGRVGIGTRLPTTKLHVAGSFRADGNVALHSSRAVKTGFGPVSPAEMLARVADLPVASWRYKTEDEETRHIGPFAEDFQRLFGLGDGETISVIDAQGVALAAIQGLQQELAAKDAEVEALRQAGAEREAQLADLRSELEELKAALAAR